MAHIAHGIPVHNLTLLFTTSTEAGAAATSGVDSVWQEGLSGTSSVVVIVFICIAVLFLVLIMCVRCCLRSRRRRANVDIPLDDMGSWDPADEPVNPFGDRKTTQKQTTILFKLTLRIDNEGGEIEVPEQARLPRERE